MFLTRPALILSICIIIFAACTPQNQPQAFQATVAPTEAPNAPVYTPTATFTLTLTVTPTSTLTLTLSPTPTPTFTLTPTLTPSPLPTQPLWTLTPPSALGAPPPFENPAAEVAATSGWGCGDFPCEDDIDGFKERIRVPEGYGLEHLGRFPGQPLQITYGPDGRLYATLITDASARLGAVFAMDAEGQSERYSGGIISPIGLAFQPGTDVLYVSGRVMPTKGGGIWRIPSGGGDPIPVIEDLPCCYGLIDNQPNGMTFGPDGYLYIGVGALTDRAEPPNPRAAQMIPLVPLEASILRVQPHTGEVEVYASGVRNPFDLTFDSNGQMYATDQGLVTGPGDRLLAVDQGGHYGWPFWRFQGCENCPLKPGDITVSPELFNFPDFSIPRGIIAYTGAQFPSNLFDSLFVVLWNGIEGGQRVLRIDPRALPQANDENPIPSAEPFITGLIRPIDVTVAPDGSLVAADFIYGHVWKVSYQGER